MSRDIADIVGHNIQFSIFNRGLLALPLFHRRRTFSERRRRSPDSNGHQMETSKRFGNTKRRSPK